MALGKIVGVTSVKTTLPTKLKNSTSSSKTKTSDLEYSALLAHLNAIPALLPVKRSMTRAKEQEVLFEDLFNKDGEATW